MSVELAVKDFSYNAKDKTLVINDFKFTGICLLGSKVKPGMAGAHASIEDFSLKSSMDDVYEEGHKLVQEFADVVSKFKEWYSETTKEGENTNKFDQLLEKYGKTAEDIDFEYEGLSDEELEAKFAEVFEDEKEDVADNGNGNVDDDIDDNADDNQDDNADDNADDNTDNDNDDVDVDFKKKRKCSIEINGEMHEFELSLQDTIDALYQLVNSTYGAEDNTWYSVTVYEDHVIMHDYWSGLHYSQKYSVTDDVYSLDGEREQVFAEFLTSTELESLKEMRATYEALKTFKANVEAAELHSQREAILADERYSIMKDDRKYRALCKNMDNYSLDELTKEVKALHSDYVSEHADSFNFSADEKKHRAKVAYGITFEQEDKPYASLF